MTPLFKFSTLSANAKTRNLLLISREGKEAGDIMRMCWPTKA